MSSVSVWERGEAANIAASLTFPVLAAFKGRFLGRDERFAAFRCAFAPHPPCPLLP